MIVCIIGGVSTDVGGIDGGGIGADRFMDA